MDTPNRPTSSFLLFIIVFECEPALWQKTAFRNWFSPSLMWVWGLNSGFLAYKASPSTL